MGILWPCVQGLCTTLSHLPIGFPGSGSLSFWCIWNQQPVVARRLRELKGKIWERRGFLGEALPGNSAGEDGFSGDDNVQCRVAEGVAMEGQVWLLLGLVERADAAASRSSRAHAMWA